MFVRSRSAKPDEGLADGGRRRFTRGFGVVVVLRLTALALAVGYVGLVLVGAIGGK